MSKRNIEILAAALDGRDALAFELGGDDHGLERTRQPRVADLDALERRPARIGSRRARTVSTSGSSGTS